MSSESEELKAREEKSRLLEAKAHFDRALRRIVDTKGAVDLLRRESFGQLEIVTFFLKNLNTFHEGVISPEYEDLRRHAEEILMRYFSYASHLLDRKLGGYTRRLSELDNQLAHLQGPRVSSQ